MKKRLLSLLLCGLLPLCAACGAATTPASDQKAPEAGGQNGRDDFEYFSDTVTSYADDAPQEFTETQSLTAAAGVPAPAVTEGDKIIWSAYAEVETQDLDATVAAVRELLERWGGFTESSAITGTDYYGSPGRGRSARFVLRIPREHFPGLTEALSTLGNIPYFESDAVNVTPAYRDTESRLRVLRIEEERLFAMLEKATTVEEMLSVEERLSELRYEIESLNSDLLGWDSLVNYSTVELYIREVAEYTQEVPVQRTYWQQLVDEFVYSMESVGDFFRDFLRLLVGALPVLAVLAILAVPAWRLFRRLFRKLRDARAARQNKE